MPKVGFEPTRGCPQRFLRPPRLPFRHFGLAPADLAHATATATVTIALGYPRRRLEALFADVRQAAVLTNAAGVKNDENGYAVYVCRHLRMSWTEAWRHIKHYNR